MAKGKICKKCNKCILKQTVSQWLLLDPFGLVVLQWYSMSFSHLLGSLLCLLLCCAIADMRKAFLDQPWANMDSTMLLLSSPVPPSFYVSLLFAGVFLDVVVDLPQIFVILAALSMAVRLWTFVVSGPAHLSGWPWGIWGSSSSCQFQCKAWKSCKSGDDTKRTREIWDIYQWCINDINLSMLDEGDLTSCKPWSQ